MSLSDDFDRFPLINKSRFNVRTTNFRENELLKRENELLKREILKLKGGE